jgi:hypothetical protein
MGYTRFFNDHRDIKYLRVSRKVKNALETLSDTQLTFVLGWSLNQLEYLPNYEERVKYCLTSILGIEV